MTERSEILQVGDGMRVEVDCVRPRVAPSSVYLGITDGDDVERAWLTPEEAMEIAHYLTVAALWVMDERKKREEK